MNAREENREIADRWPTTRAAGPGLTAALGLYLFVLVMVACWALIAIFPRSVILRGDEPPRVSESQVDYSPVPVPGARPASAPIVQLEFSPFVVAGLTVVPKLHPDQGLLVLALLAGILGSFLHAAQSLAAYVGNRELRPSWILWYTQRPLIGGVLGLLFYFVVRAGLISASADSVSPYGVVAFGALAGWFSKQATEKLAEVSETLFRAAKIEDYKDKLVGTSPWPRILKIDPPRLEVAGAQQNDAVFTVTGEAFAPGAAVTVNGRILPVRLIAENQLEVRVPSALVAEDTSELIFSVINPTSLGSAPGTPPPRSESFKLAVVRLS